MTMPHTLLNIYRHPQLNTESLERIAAAHTRVAIKKGDFILQQGQVANDYYCVESGWIRSFAYSAEGVDITTDFVGAEEIAIEVASLFMRVPTQENIQALTDCTGWRIDFDVFQELFHTIPGFMEWGRAWMSGALFQTKQRSLSMITSSATDRYLALQAHKPDLLLHAPLKFIASYLGVTDTSLSRIRKEVSRT